MFEHTITARFDDIDYAGRVFYGRLFNYSHVAEEEWFDAVGYPIPYLAEELGVLFPMAHAEADFRGPIELGDDVSVHVGVDSFGTKSFDVRAHAENLTQDHEAFRIDLTRVCLSTDDDGTQPIPDEFRSALEPYQWSRSDDGLFD